MSADASADISADILADTSANISADILANIPAMYIYICRYICCPTIGGGWHSCTSVECGQGGSRIAALFPPIKRPRAIILTCRVHIHRQQKKK